MQKVRLTETLCSSMLLLKARQLPLKVTVQFERCFRLMEHISVSSCHNPNIIIYLLILRVLHVQMLTRSPINLYITEKLIKFSKSLFNFYLVISNI